MIDTHAHLFLCTRPIEELLQNAAKAGVTHMVHVSLDIATSRQVIGLSERYPQLIPTVGLYPSEAEHDVDMSEVEALIQHHPVKAIGEIGLDFYKNYATKAKQIALFEAQLHLAEVYDLPVLIHNRHADTEMLDVFKHFPRVRKVFHCFSSSIGFAEAILALSPHTYFSFAGMVTYTSDDTILNALRGLPIDKLLVETDCPYLTPAPFRGQENQPSFVVETARKIAELKHLSLEEVDQITTQNARLLLAL